MYDNILVQDIKHFVFIGRTTLKYDSRSFFLSPYEYNAFECYKTHCEEHFWTARTEASNINFEASNRKR